MNHYLIWVENVSEIFVVKFSNQSKCKDKCYDETTDAEKDCGQGGKCNEGFSDKKYFEFNKQLQTLFYIISV